MQLLRHDHRLWLYALTHKYLRLIAAPVRLIRRTFPPTRIAQDWKRMKFLRILRFQTRSACPVVFPISSLSFITIAFDFYVSISEYTHAWSVPINTACHLGPTIPATRNIIQAILRTYTRIFIDSGPCMRVR